MTKGRMMLKNRATLEGSTMCIRGKWMINCSEFIMFTRYSILPVPAINRFITNETKNVIYKIVSVDSVALLNCLVPSVSGIYFLIGAIM